jgi:UDP-2,4-diacetamido-2,4,6-trideoxy-beta-L-altropyranose hydrolase
MNTLVRTIASADAGMGHLVRTLALVKPLSELGSVWVATETKGDELINRIQLAGCTHIALEPNTMPDDEIARILAGTKGTPIHLVISDHYDLDASWHAAIRPHTQRILAIDDLGDRPLDCDFLLDPNLGADPSSYSVWVPQHCVRLCGAHYALLRPAFAKLRRKAKKRTKLKRILISFGGGDPKNLTQWACTRILKDFSQLKLDVVIGPSHPSREHLHELAAKRHQVRVFEDLDANAFGELMLAADLAIGGGGQTSWERCALGLPSLLVNVADNQESNTRALTRAGAALMLGTPDDQDQRNNNLHQTIATLLHNPEALQVLSIRALPLVDGRGPLRVAARLVAPTVRLATRDDSESLWLWANDPSATAKDSQPADTQKMSHEEWLQDVLTTTDKHLFMGEWVGQTVGSCQFDMRGEEAKVSLMLAPAYRGLGLSTPLLRASINAFWEKRPNVPLVAHVPTMSIEALRLYTACGFEPVRSDENEMHRFVLTPE